MEIKDIKTFITAGKSLFTVQNSETGNRFTYRLTKAADKALWFVSVLNGPDNYSNYAYVGAIFDTEFKLTGKSKVTEEALSYKVFKWFWNKILNNSLPETIKVHHEGKCGRCGRRLTVPESIESGYGPECITLIGG